MEARRAEEGVDAVGTKQGLPVPRILTSLTMCVAVSFCLLVVPTSTPVPFAGWYVLSSLVPAVALTVFRPRRVALVVVCAVVGITTAMIVDARIRSDPFQQRHDGGVVATAAAAQMVLDGVNPYTADFEPALQPDHSILDPDGETPLTNPLVSHYPYLPAAFLVQVPLELIASSFGSHVDPRWLYAVSVAGALALIIRSPRPTWARAAALAAIGLNLAVASYLSWGANDAPAAALVVLAAYNIHRRPVIAGLVLAVGVALKALLVVAAVPLFLLALRFGGPKLVARFLGSSMLLLTVTTVPFLLLSPSDFLQDTVSFNLGRTELAYPTSGIGLGAALPSVFTEPVIALTSVLLLGLTSVAGARLLRRRPSASSALFVAGWLVLAGLLPARSFQMSYLPLPVVLWAFVWLDSAEWWPKRWRPASATTVVPSSR